MVWADANGTRTGRITPLNDFPDAEGFDVGDVAAGPQKVVVSGIAQAGEKRLRRPPRHVILTYDLTGALRQQWLVNPYHHHAIAVDQRGNVYALGHRITRKRAANLILKYSPDGVVEREFLSPRLFPNGEQAAMADGSSGWNQLWVDGERLLVYLARPQELFQFDLDGNLQQRTSLRAPLARLAKTRGGTRAVVIALVGDGRSGSLLAQLHISGETKISFALARLPLDGGPPTIVEPTDGGELGTMQMPLLGRKGDSTLFLNRYTATILQR